MAEDPKALRIALERITQAAEQHLMTDGDEARNLELRVKLGEAVTDASILLRPSPPPPLKWGDRVRTACTATGRYLGRFDGQELALFVSAMDNSVCIDLVKQDGDPPHPDLPVPTNRELEAAWNGILHGKRAKAGA